ncbi:hypothetical protein [Herbiconiux sp.]|uniref:hypothetical protein n=1 Tax=Herbiconiux sp. TaxID=1871186 RepID=UPI0025C686C0|nr:hypothetical protein [Herbiconiux sp.]
MTWLTGCARVQGAEDGIRDPKEWLIATARMGDPEARIEALGLQCNEMRTIISILRGTTGFKGQIEHIHRYKVMIERFEALAAIPLKAMGSQIEVGDHHVHRAEFHYALDDPPAACFAFVAPVKFDLAREEKRPQLHAQIIASSGGNERNTHGVLLMARTALRGRFVKEASKGRRS